MPERKVAAVVPTATSVASSSGHPPSRSTPSRPSTSLDPQAILAIRDLELRTRIIMEGVRAGLHRSPFTGWSAEFTEYRPYAVGDDLRHLDWRVLARTDRHYLKKFEDETNLRCWLLVDTSRSMSFGAGSVTKAAYARTLAATLAWFLHQQRDVVGVALFDQRLHDVVPPRWRPGHLRHVFASLDREPNGRDTDLATSLSEIGRLCHRRSMVVIVSDFLTPPDEWSRALAQLSAARHDVRAIQILDPAELSLEGYGRPALWEDLETGEIRYVDPAHARAAYRERIEAHSQALRLAFDRGRVSRQLATTTEPFDRVLLRFLDGKAPPSSGYERERVAQHERVASPKTR